MVTMYRQRGFSYLLLLFAVAALGVAAAGTSLMWSTLSQIERERELLFIGGEFARALQRYHDASPTDPKAYPARLEDLTEDKRFPTPVRHLRKIYVDPMTGNRDWGLVIGGGQIRAVYSRSEKKAHIHVLPAWVETTGDKLAASLKTSTSARELSGTVAGPGQSGPNSPGLQQAGAPTNTQAVATGSPSGQGASASAGTGRRAADNLRHADWLFVPVADGAAAGKTGAAGSAGSRTAASESVQQGGLASGQDGASRSLQEQYTEGTGR